MKGKSVIISLFMVSLMLFLGVGIYMTGAKHIQKSKENIALNKEKTEVKKANCAIEFDNSRLVVALDSLQIKIQYLDSFAQHTKKCDCKLVEKNKK